MACCTKLRPNISTCLRLWKTDLFSVIVTKTLHTNCLNFTKKRLLCSSSVTRNLDCYKYIHNVRSLCRFNSTKTPLSTMYEQKSESGLCQRVILLQKIRPFCHQQSRNFSLSRHKNVEVKPLKASGKTRFCLHQICGFSTSCNRNIKINQVLKTPAEQTLIKKRNTEHKNLNAVKTPAQTLIKKRARPKSKHTERTGNREVIAYATAEEYDLESLKTELVNQGLYNITNLPFDMTDVIHVTPKYNVNGTVREIFFLREGSVVFWEVTEGERDEVLRVLMKHGKFNHDIAQSHRELEWIQFKETQNESNLLNGVIQLNSTCRDEEDVLEKYSFSHALSQSVQLNMWEAALDDIIDETDDIAKKLRLGKSVKLTRAETLQKLGQLFQLRHSLNLTSDLLDTPDFYWDREHLEKLYLKCYNFLEVTKRIRVMNSKLNYCVELMELVKDQLNDKHHVNLEIMIIVLILIEVVFEIIALAREYMHKRVE